MYELAELGKYGGWEWSLGRGSVNPIPAVTGVVLVGSYVVCAGVLLFVIPLGTWGAWAVLFWVRGWGGGW